MTLALLNTWIELQDIDCPPHLRAKRIIDRLGRRTYRCVTPDDTVANVTIEGVPEEDKKKFSLGRKPVNARHTFEWSGKVTNSSTVEFLRLLNDEGLNSDYSELIESYLNYPNWDVMGIPDNPEASDKMNLLRNKLNYHISQIGYDKIMKDVIEVENSIEFEDLEGEEPNEVPGYRDFRVENMIDSWKGNSTTGKPAQAFQEIVSYLSSGSEDRFATDYNKIHLPELGSPADNLDENMLYQRGQAVSKLIENERKLWKSLIGDKPIRVYRGIKIYEDVPELGSNTIEDFPVSSWSLSPRMANGFGNVVLAKTITADDIIFSPFSLGGRYFTGGYTSIWDRETTPTDDELLRYMGKGQLALLEGEIVLYTPEEGTEVDVVSRWEHATEIDYSDPELQDVVSQFEAKEFGKE